MITSLVIVLHLLVFVSLLLRCVQKICLATCNGSYQSCRYIPRDMYAKRSTAEQLVIVINSYSVRSCAVIVSEKGA
ncbi:hypothetical protein GGR52DRAFT_444193 [Hypoxylon sp. FL1284]|nr:hypothetical protein GGR52DRAFT_444193 [Hypoxylon sp. FL1284]